MAGNGGFYFSLHAVCFVAEARFDNVKLLEYKPENPDTLFDCIKRKGGSMQLDRMKEQYIDFQVSSVEELADSILDEYLLDIIDKEVEEMDQLLDDLFFLDLECGSYSGVG